MPLSTVKPTLSLPLTRTYGTSLTEAETRGKRNRIINYRIIIESNELWKTVKQLCERVGTKPQQPYEISR